MKRFIEYVVNPILHSIAFGLMLLCLLGSFEAAYSQTHELSQETINALNEERIIQLERESSTNSKDIALLAREVSGLKSSIDRFTGVGIGLGATLTVIQGMLLLITYVTRRKV